MNIRLTIQEDLDGIKTVLDGTELFPSDMLEDMIGPYLIDKECPDIWLSAVSDDEITGFCYAVPEQLADGAWNMLAIAVLPNKQSGGVGAQLTKHLETLLSERGQRLLIVDTSGAEEFAATRRFYAKNGYAEEARIRDFWAEGDDKVIFRKSLR